MLAEPGAFDRFYWDTWRVDPFPWQSELAEQVQADGRWPELIDLPTGTGKTATIDVALFLLARDAARPPTERRMPRRIVTVVDRRVVVDQADERAQALCERLQAAPSDSVAAAVATALRGMWGGSAQRQPFVTSVLRGGIVRDESWARRPDVPAVIASTVDQVGSRLLFRGYGLSARMAPLHAGLLGSDTLFLLDEVHLSRAFAETLRRLRQHRPDASVPTRWSVVELSATPGAAGRSRFPSEPLDPNAHPVLGRRLLASKPTTLKPSRGRDRSVLARDCSELARGLLTRDHVKALAVVVNRVQSAREVAAHLSSAADAPEVVVLTGRMRPIVRDRVVGALAKRLRTGRIRTAEDSPLIVVATQCIEAGADFDFDGLVTECASLPALRQRFGRVDRDGRLAEAGTPAPGVVVALGAEVAAGDDPIYGPALANTWRAMDTVPGVDFGVTALSSLGIEDQPGLTTDAVTAPYLLPAHLDAWVQTQPKPVPDPDPALWLHGLERPAMADVQVVWRADVGERFLSAGDGRDGSADPLGLITACPPVATEAMSLPISAVRAWLAESPDIPAVADVEGAEIPATVGPARGRPVARWRRGEAQLVTPGEPIVPGDVLVVPAVYGGIDRHGNWDPSSSRPVEDLAGQAYTVQRERVMLRLVPPLWSDAAGLPLPAQVPDDVSDTDAVLEWLAGQDDDRCRHCVKHRRSVRVRRVTGPGFRMVPAEDGEPTRWAETAEPREYFVVACIEPYKSTGAGAGYNPDGDESSFIARRVDLNEHLEGVERWARRLARECGLAPELADDLALAGRLHDLGKADPRFQVVLYDGDEIGAASGQLLAKSAQSELDRRRRQRLRARSGYPQGMRHELMSLALVEGRREFEERAHDWDLVQYLISSHHGWCRPFPPAVLDPDPTEVKVRVGGIELIGTSDHGLSRLDRGIPDRFWLLVDRYGHHGLAWLEAIFQLADHHCSAEEQLRTVGGES